jgi:chromosomal replication initiation ATPase DnaA
MSAADRKTGRAEQLPLSFSHQPASGRDDLVVSDPLDEAAAIIDRWPTWPSPVVVITGPAGSGKSHLADVWLKTSGAVAIDLSSGAAATGEALNKAAEGPVLLEDADRSGFDETALFHVINAVRSHATSLLITARSRPGQWNVTLPDLASRLKAATVVEVGLPDDAALKQILFKLFADRQLLIDDRLASYIVSRMERSVAAAQAIVERIDHLALARGVKINRALAAEVLGEFAADA